MENLVLPMKETKPQPVEHRLAKAYVVPRLKVYGEMSELTAAGSGPTPEGGSESRTKFP